MPDATDAKTLDVCRELERVIAEIRMGRRAGMPNKLRGLAITIETMECHDARA